MSKQNIEIDIQTWIRRAEADRVTYRQRQVTNIVLTAIAGTPKLKANLFLKGGTLMGLAYDSPRQTSDIDFSVGDGVSVENASDHFTNLLNSALPRAAVKIGYADIIVRVQTIKKLPQSKFPNASFPALKLVIAYANRGGGQEKQLYTGQASDTIALDLSFNETTSKTQVLEFRGGEELEAYSLTDLIAEKYRALHQQEKRNRYRSQDVYDLDFLIRNCSFNDEEKTMILVTLLEKCRSRDINAAPISIDNSEIRMRAQSEWKTLKLEIGEVPDFEDCFERITIFYKQLPWSKM